jgi:hypothetical protein
MAHSAVLRSFRAWISVAAATKAKRVAAQVKWTRAEADTIKLELSNKAAALQNVGPSTHCSPNHRMPFHSNQETMVQMRVDDEAVRCLADIARCVIGCHSTRDRRFQSACRR